MKRILFLLLTLCVFIFTFSACSGKAENETQPTETTVPQEKEYTLVIDADNFDETFSEGAFYDELDSIKGITYSKNETANEYTLRMTESAYKTLREKKAEPVYSAYEDLISNEENYVKDIEYDDDFRNVTIIADEAKLPGETLNAADNVILSVAISAMAYQFYTVEGQQVKVTVVNSADDSVIKEVVYPIIT